MGALRGSLPPLLLGGGSDDDSFFVFCSKKGCKKRKLSEWIFKNYIRIKFKKFLLSLYTCFNSVLYNPKTMPRGRGKGLRGEGRVSLFPACPISLSGRHCNEKCLRHFPDYCLALAEVILHREIKCHAHLATAKYIA